MRSLVVLLLLGLVFFIGMVLGIDRGHGIVSPNGENIENTVKQEKVDKEQIVVVKQEVDDKVIKAEPPVHFAQKAATFLEKAVIGLFDMILGIIYQVVQLFF